LIEIKDIQNFEWQGEDNNLFIRISCHPYVLHSKRAQKLQKQWVIQNKHSSALSEHPD